MEQKYLYVVFSATPYRMGAMIRAVTREPYNHVAIAMEKDLRRLYAFARRYYRTPFYGGFVTEAPCRYHHRGRAATIRVCKIPVSDGQWATLHSRLEEMRVQADRYLYNHLSAAAAPFHHKILVRDAYTCAEFAVSVLKELGYGFDSRNFYSIGAISQALEDFRVYDGEFPLPPEEADPFFAHRSLGSTLFLTARDLGALFWRKALT